MIGRTALPRNAHRAPGQPTPSSGVPVDFPATYSLSTVMELLFLPLRLKCGNGNECQPAPAKMNGGTIGYQRPTDGIARVGLK